MEPNQPNTHCSEDDVIIVNDTYSLTEDDTMFLEDVVLQPSGSNMFQHGSQSSSDFIPKSSSSSPHENDPRARAGIPGYTTMYQGNQIGNSSNLHGQHNSSEADRGGDSDSAINDLLAEILPKRERANKTEREHVQREVKSVPIYRKPAKDLPISIREDRLRYELSLWNTIDSVQHWDNSNPQSNGRETNGEPAGKQPRTNTSQEQSGGPEGRMATSFNPDGASNIVSATPGPRTGVISLTTQGTEHMDCRFSGFPHPNESGNEEKNGKNDGPTQFTWGWCCAKCPQCWGETQIGVEDHHYALVKVNMEIPGDAMAFAERTLSTFIINTRNKDHMTIKDMKFGRQAYWQEQAFYIKLFHTAEQQIHYAFPFVTFREVGMKCEIDPLMVTYMNDQGKINTLRASNAQTQSYLDSLSPPLHACVPHEEGMDPRNFDGVITLTMTCHIDTQPVKDRQLLYNDDLFAQRLKNIVVQKDRYVESYFGKLARILYAFDEHQRMSFDKISTKDEPPYKTVEKPFKKLPADIAPRPLNFSSESSSAPKDKKPPPPAKPEPKPAPEEKDEPKTSDKLRRRKPAKEPDSGSSNEDRRYFNEPDPYHYEDRGYNRNYSYANQGRMTNPWIMKPRPMPQQGQMRPAFPPPRNTFRQ
jgi:hypothetical protein